MSGGQGGAGSNPAVPTNKINNLHVLTFSKMAMCENNFI